MSFPKHPRAVVTGAGSGFGRAVALNLAARGGRILVADVNEAGAAETVRLVEAAGGQAVALRCDVSRVADLERAAAEVERLWGGTDILVNNAGVAAAGLVGELPLADWNWILGINLLGVIHGCHVFVPHFRQAKRGFVLNVAAAAGFISLPEMAAYNVTKAGVISLSETLYGELGAHGVNVTVACPSFFKTNLMDTFRASGERQRKAALSLFAKSKVTADHVAAQCLTALEAGRLYAIPQTDAKLLWRLKRLTPAGYFGAIRKTFHSPWVDRLLLK
jgi:NAD(P)-dependent dehydrogenase (short-subunit alcohol dehydrogenase family)